MMRKAIDWLATGALAVMLSGCMQPVDVEISHVHGLAHDGEALFIATHHGVARGVPGDPWTWSHVGSERFDYMGFTQDAEQAGVFYSSGHPDDPASFGGTHLGLRRSLDGAQTWEQRSLKGQVDFHALASTGKDSLAGYWRGNVMLSTDAGATWSEIPAPAPVTALAGEPGRLVAATVEGLYRLEGEEWTPLDSDLGVASSLVIGPAWFASTADGQSGSAYRSLDQATWTKLSAEQLHTPHPVLFAIDPTDPEHVFASTSTALVMESFDHGRTWQAIREP